MAQSNKITVHVDGGARGNPGPAALGVVFAAPLNKEYSSYLGVKTNNEAEYSAVVFALQKLKSLLGKDKTKNTEVQFFMDSELAVKQLSYQYKIESPNIIPLFIKIHNLRLGFDKVAFTHVPREKNKDADRMVNVELDKRMGKNLFNS
ncbi:MAG: ribonuclease HI family protein [Candidatus Spechtbacterales bacterium]